MRMSVTSTGPQFTGTASQCYGLELLNILDVDGVGVLIQAAKDSDSAAFVIAGLLLIVELVAQILYPKVVSGALLDHGPHECLGLFC
jgi:hypothetical protein